MPLQRDRFGRLYHTETPRFRNYPNKIRVSIHKAKDKIFLPGEFSSLDDIRWWQNTTALTVFLGFQNQGYLQQPVLLINNRPAQSVQQAKIGDKFYWLETAGAEEEEEEPFFTQALAYAHHTAIRTTPRDTGKAQANFIWILPDGSTSQSPPDRKWKYGDVVYLVNRAPYMRKIEEQKQDLREDASKLEVRQGHSRYSAQAPNGVMRVISKRTRSRFRKYVSARMLLVRKWYMGLPGGTDIQTPLKDNRYPGMRFIYKGTRGYAENLRAGFRGGFGYNLRGRQ